MNQTKATLPRAFMLLCSCLTICTLAAMPIERVMREYQAKYHFVWSTKDTESKKASAPYVEWPAGYNGPAPHFPPDGFYGDIDQDPDLGVIVVSALQWVFGDVHHGVYFYYAKGTSSTQLAGHATIIPYTRGDFTALDTTLDRGNYAGVFSSLASYIQSLKYFNVTSLTLRECARHSGDSPRCCSSGAAEGVASISWLASSWDPVMWLPEMYVMQQVLPPGREECPDIPTYTLNLEATRACLVASVPGAHDGKYTWLLRVLAQAEGYGENTPPVPADDVYHVWGGPQEAGSECVSALLADGKPIVGSWSGPDKQCHVKGWVVQGFSAVFEPSYDDLPEQGSCCSSCSAGATTIRCDSLFMSIGFGTTKSGKSAGFLMLKEQAPSILSTTPENLRYCAYSDGSASLSWSGSAQLSQIIAGEVAVNINIKGTNSYELGLYHANQVTGNREGLADGSTRQSLTGFPFKSVSVTNLNQSVNQIRITELDNGVSTVSEFNWTHGTQPGAGTWTLSRAGNLVQEQSQTSFNTDDHTRTEARWIKDSSNNVIYQESTTYHLYDWGERMVQKTVGSGSNALTTQWTIYDAPTDGANFGQVKTAVYPGGRWEYNAQYNAMRPTMVFGPLGNQPVPASGTNPLFDSGVCTINSYSGGYNSTTEYRKGVPVALRYRSFSAAAGYYLDEVCLRTNASRGSPDNLRTTTQRDMTGDQTFGQMQFRRAPDGTVEISNSTLSGSGYWETTTLTGAWDGYVGITHGRKVVTDTDDAGNVWSRKLYDVSPPGATETLVEEAEYSQPDPDFGRPQRVDYNAGPYKGLYELTTYGCCGVYSHTDVQGIQTQYSYDVLKRQTADTRNGILHTNVLDAAGQVLATYVKAGTTNRLISQTAYDLAGRVVSEINALGAVITHGEGFTNISGTTMWPRTVTTVNNVDQGNRQEGYYCDGRLFEVTGTATAHLRYFYGVEQDSAAILYATTTTEVKVGDLGETNEWVRTYYDMAGRVYKRVYSATTPTETWSFNSQGQLNKSVDLDGVTTLYEYNDLGERDYTTVDISGVAGRQGASTDRITRVLKSLVTGTTNVWRTDRIVWPTDGVDSTVTVERTDQTVDGQTAWHVVWTNAAGPSNPIITTEQTAYDPPNARRTVTQTAPDGSKTVSVYQNGLLSTITCSNSAGAQITQTTYSYDGFGRQYQVTDARNGATTYTYNNADQVQTVTAPDLGTGEAAQATTTFYDNLGRVTGTQNPDGTTATLLYYPTGLLQQTYGSRIYPVAYTYSGQGRMLTMTTWQNGSASAVTRWNYDGYRGWLNSKDYPDRTTGQAASSSGPSYTYWPSGRLKTRTWKRGTITTYTYNGAGDLNTVAYTDGTPGVTYTYDRLGRRKTVVSNGITTSLAYNDANELLTESYSGGTLAGLSVNNGYNNYLQRQTVTARNGGTTLQGTAYGYDTAGRLLTVTDSPYVATYTYQVNSLLLNTVTFKNGTTTNLVTTRQYDRLNRLQSIANLSAQPPTVNSFGYAYNSANQRTRSALADGSYWAYQYDTLGQVTSGRRYWSDGTPVAGQQFTYVEDSIGNRTAAGNGGDANGQNLRSWAYTPNRLNQYTSRTVPAAVDVLGIANPTAAVTVNGNTAYRHGEYFDHALPVANGSVAQYPTLTVTSTYGSQQSTSGSVWVPQTPESYGYDLDGNLTSDGRWTYTWDGENRLVRMMARTSVGPQQRIDCEYDHQGRRIGKKVWNNTVGTGNLAVNLRFLYDGWNLVAELNATNNLVIRGYVWGNDLSGSLQGAGGVGGLLKVTYYGSTTTNAVVAYDGNGNVTALIDASNGTPCAQYEYGPFGEVIRLSGQIAKVNPLCFSAKYQDDETDLLYYGYRYYNPSTGAWPSRDPIGELQRRSARAENLCSFCGNDGVDYWDYVGLWLGSDHRSLTSKSFSSAWSGLGDTSPCSGKKLLSVISDANVATDKEPDASDLKQHYNRAFWGTDPIETSRNAYVSHVQSVVADYSKLLEAKSDRAKCVEALQKLGQVSHSWQDYYAHAIGLNSPYWGDPGPVEGDPDSPSANLKPASWGGNNNWGEHGPSEPASREPDFGLNRYNKAESFVEGKYPKMLQAWLAKCRCYCGENWP